MVVVVVVARACFLGTTLGETFGFGFWAVVWTALGEPGFAPTSGLTPTGGFGFGLGAVGGGPTNDRAQKNRHIVLDGVIKRIPWMGVGVATGTDCERMDFRQTEKVQGQRKQAQTRSYTPGFGLGLVGGGGPTGIVRTSGHQMNPCMRHCTACARTQ